MSSKLLYLRIPGITWDAIAEEAERTGLSFAKAGIAILERGIESGRPVPVYTGPLSPTPLP